MQLGNTIELPKCLTASASVACVGPSADPGPVEPGNPYTFTYKIQLNNATKKQFSATDSGGYNVYAYTDNGLKPNFSNPVSTTPIRAGPDSPSGQIITASIPVYVDYTGSFWVQFRFKNSTLGLGDWNGECGNPANTDSGGVGQTGSDTPQTRPYFQVWYGDTKAGGGFSSSNNTCSTTYPSYVSPISAQQAGRTDTGYYGGIRSFAVSQSRGSATDFGAVALGLIQGPANTIGFYSHSSVYFANEGIPSGGMGGYLNSNSTEHCVNDYYTNTRVKASPGSIGSGWSGNPGGQYQLSGSVLHGGSLGNKQITIYVNGNVTIDGNITYPDTFDPNTQSNIPYFALIVNGNITVASNVTRLDGLYVAQPNSGGSDGVFSTCDSICPDQLVVNGAVIAQKVDLLRSHGTVGPLSTDPNGIGTDPAEIFNYVPSMVIGAPDFQSQTGGVETIFNLPPVF